MRSYSSPVKAGKATDQAADPLDEYRMRTVRVAVVATYVVVGLLLLLPVMPGHPPVNMKPYVVLVIVAVTGAAAAGLLPWRWLFAAGWGERVMYVWSTVDILLVTAALGVTGGPRSDVVFLYALTTIFFAASYPIAGQAGLFALTCAAYLALVVGWHEPTPAASVVLRLAPLAVAWFMVGYLARERNAQLAAYLDARELAEHRAELLGVVARTAAAITTLDADQVMAGVSDSLIDLGFDVANFDVFDEGARSYRILHGRGLPDAFTEAVHPASLGMPGLVLSRRSTVVLEDYASYAMAVPALRHLGVQVVVGVPVWVNGQPEAVLIGGRITTRQLPAADIEVVEILAAQVGRALENAKRFRDQHDVAQAASAASLLDELTGVGNRRQANLMLERLRPGDALVLIDLDHFKEVNDERGHAAGDAVLRDLGRHLREAVRDVDDVARYGGEEFLLLLRQAGEDPLPVVERILQSWRALNPGATFSAGVAQHDGDHPATITVGQADAALYAAKRTGRDRVCSYGSGLEDDEATARA